MEKEPNSIPVTKLIIDEEIDMKAKLIYDGTNIQLASRQDTKAAFVYFFNTGRSLEALNLRLKDNNIKKRFTPEERDNIRKAVLVVNKMMKETWSQILIENEKKKTELITEPVPAANP